LEEAVDVAIMVKQIAYMFGEDKFDEAFKEKLEKIRLHIENSKRVNQWQR